MLMKGRPYHAGCEVDNVCRLVLFEARFRAREIAEISILRGKKDELDALAQRVLVLHLPLDPLPHQSGSTGHEYALLRHCEELQLFRKRF
eukprot:3817232-Rhodomonas_salina.1